MQKFTWDDSISLGVQLLDEQHKTWIEKLNSLSEAIELHQETQHVSTMLQFMMDYMEFHFAAEEQLMTEQKYPHIDQHIHEHRQFASYMMDLLMLEIQNEDTLGKIANSVNTFQISWMKNHILNADKKLADFLHHQADA
jgi:hemerythrin